MANVFYLLCMFAWMALYTLPPSRIVFRLLFVFRDIAPTNLASSPSRSNNKHNTAFNTTATSNVSLALSGSSIKSNSNATGPGGMSKTTALNTDRAIMESISNASRKANQLDEHEWKHMTCTVAPYWKSVRGTDGKYRRNNNVLERRH